jgi:hypothetical protein
MIRSSLALSVAVLAFVGCVGAKLGGGRQGAAQALAMASSAALTGNAAAGASGGTASFACPHGGSVVVTLTSTTTTSQDASFAAQYQGCSVDGKNRFDGTLTTTMTFESSSTGGAFVMHMAGEITISGDVSDFLRADITERMSFTTTTSSTTTSVHATIVLDGWIETSSDHYAYSAETFEVDTSAELPRG